MAWRRRGRRGRSPLRVPGADSKIAMATNRDGVSIENGRALSDGLVLLCEADGRRFGVPRHLVAPQREVQQPEDHGRLSIARRPPIDLGFA